MTGWGWVLLAGCAAAATPRGDDSAGATSGGSSASRGAGPLGEPGDGPGDEGEGPGTAADTGEGCAELVATPDLYVVPADIVVITDNSGSMADEVAGVSANLGVFAQAIVATGIDVHVVLISEYPAAPGNGICIDPPLGAGGCPDADNNPPLFLHIDQTVAHSVQPVLDTYNLWAGGLREEAVLHLLMISDDAAIAAEGALPLEFHPMFTALATHLEDYRFHSVVPHSMCAGVDGVGTEYIALSNLTGGVAADLCTQDFAAVFAELESAVIAGSPLPCEFEIPNPEPGQAIDFDHATVTFEDNGLTLDVPQVGAPTDCGATDGWHYDDPAAPTLIIMCPATCERLRTTETGTLTLELGCLDPPAG